MAGIVKAVTMQLEPEGSFRNSCCRLLEQFSFECCKTKTKVITLANHKGRRAIRWTIKTRSNYMKRGKTWAKSHIGFG